MKLLLAGLLLVSAINFAASEEAKFTCPTKPEFGKDNICDCVDEIQFLSCSKLVTTFSLKKKYHFKTIVIRNSVKLPSLLEHQLDIRGNLEFESFIVLDENVELKFPFTDNLEELMQLPTKSIKIILKSGSKQILDVSKLSSTLNSLIIENVDNLQQEWREDQKLFPEATGLNHLVLRKAKFSPALPRTMLNDKLERIELTETNVKGTLHYEPSVVCAPDSGKKLFIELHDNDDLTSIDFAKLFTTTSKDCLFHISISGKTDSLKNLFKDKAVQTVLRNNLGKYYLQLRGLKMDCFCGFWTFYNEAAKPNKFAPADYIHSVFCSNANKYIDQIAKDSEEYKNVVCKDPNS